MADIDMAQQRVYVIQFTTVHTRNDTRIRLKEVTTLADRLDARVSLFVQDGLGDEEVGEGLFDIRDTGARPGGRLKRMTLGAWRMYRAVRAARPQVAHFHDPELIPVGLALKLSGIKLVYDVHEDLPRQIMGKPYIKPFMRRLVSTAAALAERAADRCFDGILPATPAIAEHFKSRHVALVQNFPILGELMAAAEEPLTNRPANFAFVGGITEIRGISEMIDAIAQVDHPEARLDLVGTFSPQKLRDAMTASPGWERVIEHGWADRPTVAALLGQVRAGLVLYLPSPNHIAAQPNKLFEYMSAGLPVIASDFPLWRKIVEGAGCGLLVNPEDPQAIAQAMDWMLRNPAEAEAMGQRGRAAVQSTYNWSKEAETLVAFYCDELGVPLKQIH
ncbi:glycosyltransferase family 4 protein [Roseovarius nubinhibens]